MPLLTLLVHSSTSPAVQHCRFSRVLILLQTWTTRPPPSTPDLQTPHTCLQATIHAVVQTVTKGRTHLTPSSGRIKLTAHTGDTHTPSDHSPHWSSTQGDGHSSTRNAGRTCQMDRKDTAETLPERNSLIKQHQTLNDRKVPGDSMVKNLPANALDAKRHRFNPWVVKISWRRE